MLTKEIRRQLLVLDSQVRIPTRQTTLTNLKKKKDAADKSCRVAQTTMMIDHLTTYLEAILMQFKIEWIVILESYKQLV